MSTTVSQRDRSRVVLPLHPEVRRDLEKIALERDSQMAHLIFPSLWDGGVITHQHRLLFFLLRLDAYIPAKGLGDSLIQATLKPVSQDLRARRAMGQITALIESLLGRRDYDDVSDPDVRREIWDSLDWHSLAQDLIESDTFDTGEAPLSIIRSQIPVAMGTAVYFLTEGLRRSDNPRNLSMGDICDTYILNQHKNALWERLKLIHDSLYAVAYPSPRASKLNSDSVGSFDWGKSMPRDVAISLCDVIYEWFEMWKFPNERKAGDEEIISYYLENASNFTGDRVIAFAHLLHEYNVEWAMAAMEWGDN